MAIKSWFPIPKGSHFSLANIPFGVISTKSNPKPRPAIAIGESILDLATFSSHNGFSGLPIFARYVDVFSCPTLNDFAALGRPLHRTVRQYLREIFAEDTPYPDILKSNDGLKSSAIISQQDVSYHLPMEIGDYTDFFAGVNHAYNVMYYPRKLHFHTNCGYIDWGSFPWP